MNPKRKSQREQIRDLLENARGGWVAALELAKVGGLQFQTRIHELRHKFQLTIENREEWREGVCFSYYRLARDPIESLFPNLKGEHRDNG